MRHDLRAIQELKPSEQPASIRKGIMRKLLASIRDIELQLGARAKRRNPDGTEMTPVQASLWRTKAIKALNWNNQLYCEYKQLEREDNEHKLAETITGFFSRAAAYFRGAGSGVSVQNTESRGSDGIQAGTETGT